MRMSNLILATMTTTMLMLMALFWGFVLIKRDSIRRRSGIFQNVKKKNGDVLGIGFKPARSIPIPTVEQQRPRYPHPVINAGTCIGCHACVEACPHDVLSMVNGKAIVVAAEQCMEDTSCQVECPTVPKSCIVFNTIKPIPDRKVPKRDGKFMTNVPGIYLIGDVSGVPLIKNAINEGGAVIDHAIEYLKTSQNGSASYDVTIIGMGPAGLSAAILAKQRGLKYLALEQGEIASTIKDAYQAGKYVYYNPVDMPVKGGVNLPGAGAIKEQMLNSWIVSLNQNNVAINQFEGCSDIKKSGDHFIVSTQSEKTGLKKSYTTKAIVLAIGNKGAQKKLDVPGEDMKDPYGRERVKYRLSDPESYSNCSIAIVGAGNSAIEAAIDLAAYRSTDGTKITGWRNNRVALIIRSNFKSDLKLGNKIMIYDCIDEGRIKVYFEQTMKEIFFGGLSLMNARERDPKKAEVSVTLKNDYVFALIGGDKPTKFLESLGIVIG